MRQCFLFTTKNHRTAAAAHIGPGSGNRWSKPSNANAFGAPCAETADPETLTHWMAAQNIANAVDMAEFIALFALDPMVETFDSDLISHADAMGAAFGGLVRWVDPASG